MEEKIKPFDWTFTTDYTGTISGFDVNETNERIDVDKLRQRDKIMFYHELTLFEDELHDNGIAANSVKIVSCRFQTADNIMRGIIIVAFTRIHDNV